MTDTEAIEQIRRFMVNGLKIKRVPSNPNNIQAVAFMFQNAISQIPDRIILELIKQPNAKIRVQLLKPQNHENNNACHKGKHNRGSA